MTQLEQALATTRKANSHLEAALEALRANRHKYHPRTYRILEEPIVEEIELRQKEINEYLWQLDPQPDGVPVRDPEPDGPPADEVSEPITASNTLPTEEEIGKLPRWARVAFAARCARRALPLFKKHWPEATTKRVGVLEGAIHVSELTAAKFRSPPWNTDVYYWDDAIPTNANFVSLSASFAFVATDTRTYTAVVSAISNAVRSGVSIASITNDFRTIVILAEFESWTDDTPVPPTVFGPLWPDGPPAGWPEDENPDRDLVLEIDLPDDATDADVKRYVELLVSKADDVYRAGGGNGLKISGLDITGETLVAKPTPTSDQPSEELVGGAT
jgi:hypothetical protein